MNIRTYVARANRLQDLVALGSLSPQAAAFLDAAVAAGLNVLVSGATQAGRTTIRQDTRCAGPESPTLGHGEFHPNT